MLNQYTISQGNVRNLKANPFQIASPRFNLNNFCRDRERRQLVVVNKAAPAQGLAPLENKFRFRLNNLGPQPGSRKKAKRKGRGIAAGQGNSCGFGMRGQKSRSGPGVRKGFEGGQMPLYRRIPKLRGIAGGIPFSPILFLILPFCYYCFLLFHSFFFLCIWKFTSIFSLYA